MTGLQHQHGLAGELAGPQLVLPGQPVVGRQADHERLLADLGGADPALVERRRQDDGIELAAMELVEQPGRHRLLELQPQLGPAPLQRRQQVRQQIGGRGRDHPEAEAAGERLGRGLCQLAQLRHLAQHHPGLGDERQSRRRGRGAAAAALEHRHAKLLLELAHLGAERRLADMASQRRLAEMAGVGDCHHIVQITQVHGRSIGCVYRYN